MLQTVLKLPFFEKFCPLNDKERPEGLNYRINSIHEKALRVTYQDYKSKFPELLQKNDTVTIHQHNLQVFATKIFKAKDDLLSEIMKDVFELKEPSYSLRSRGNYSVREDVKTIN